MRRVKTMKCRKCHKTLSRGEKWNVTRLDSQPLCDNCRRLRFQEKLAQINKTRIATKVR